MRELVEARNSKGLRFDMSPMLANIDQVCQRTEAFLSALDIENERFDILLVLRELLNNAVIHGSRLHREKRIRVVVICAGKELNIEIKDQGQGFDWRRRIEQPFPNLSACSGRGVFIAKYFSDFCTYNDMGNKVWFIKKLSCQPTGPKKEKS
ncbi:MAG: ATP-binding protein [Desulfovermiculus sp.]